MVETLITLGGSLASMGLNALKDYLAKKKKEKEALITLDKLGRQIEDMEKKWDALEEKLRDKLAEEPSVKLVLPAWAAIKRKKKKKKKQRYPPLHSLSNNNNQKEKQ